jgi:hypothetical protein
MPAPTDDNTTETPKLDIDWLKTLAGALAAVTTAVLLSTLGAVGTLIGAALGSVAATVGSALYTQGLVRSKQAVLKAQETALHKVGIAQAEVRRAARHDGEEQEAHLDLADERLAEAKEELDAPEDAYGWRQRLGGLGWKRVALLAAATFAVVLIAISGFEAITGRSVSSYTGGSGKDQGSTFSGVTGGNSGTKDDDRGPDKPEPSESSGFTDSPSADPSEEPSDEPTEAPTGTPSSTPTPTPTPTPSASPTPTPTPTPTPSASPTPSATP